MCPTMKMLFIDHYDSFSHNVVDWLYLPRGEVEIVHVQYDQHNLLQLASELNVPIVLSPGPKSPFDVPETLALIRQQFGRVPILGICLGHQLLGCFAGFSLLRCLSPRHGSTVRVGLTEESCLYDLNHQNISVGVYNSLCLGDSPSGAADWSVTGRSADSEIQVIENWVNPSAPTIGLQFHPESFLTEDGARLRSCWYSILAQAGWCDFPVDG